VYRRIFFKSAEAMKVGSILVDVDEKSLTKDTIVIDKIEVIAPAITYEKARGTDNFNAIINNVNSFLGTEESKKESAGKETSATSGKKNPDQGFYCEGRKGYSGHLAAWRQKYKRSASGYPSYEFRW
jgi:hypothetical protein